MSTDLSIISRVKAEIAKIDNLDDIINGRGIAELKRIINKATGQHERQNAEAIKRLYLDRQAGMLIAKMELRGGDRKSKLHGETLIKSLSELGVTKIQSHRWQKLFSIPERRFDTWIAEKAADPKFEITAAGLLRDLKQRAKEQKRNSKNDRESAAVATEPELLECSVSEMESHVPASSVDVVITDPPYPEEFLPLYSDLSRFCSHALKPGAILVCMTGQSYLPEVLSRLAEQLTYRWCCAYLTPGGQAVQLWNRQVNTFWKPLLVFSNGEASTDSWIGDVLSSDVNDNDKDHHEWGQSESGMAKIVRAFSEPGQVVCDPFLGGGTTAVVACEMGRKFIGCDIDQKCVETTRERFA